jgi:hypothetical protein
LLDLDGFVFLEQRVQIGQVLNALLDVFLELD